MEEQNFNPETCTIDELKAVIEKYKNEEEKLDQQLKKQPDAPYRTSFFICYFCCHNIPPQITIHNFTIKFCYCQLFHGKTSNNGN